MAEQEVQKPNYSSKGRSGTLISGFVIENDYLPELLGISGQALYSRMELSDSQVRKLMHAVNNPIKSATWDIEPATEDEKDLKIAALIKNILFEDLPDGFTGKLDEILTFPWRGHSVFEVIHQNKDKKPFGPYTGLHNIAWRNQDTLTEWKFSREGVLESVRQQVGGDVEVDAEMPASTLLIFYNEKKGNDVGFPFLRMIYGNYKRKLLYKQLQAIGIERAALPVPHLKLPNDVKYDSAEAKDAESQLQRFTQAETSYFITPYGYELNLNAATAFNPANVQTAIKAENEEIVGSLIGMFLEMGIGGNSGNQAGTSVSAEFFRDGIEYIANKIKDKINRELIPQLVALNFGDTVEVLPQLTHSGISDEVGKELMEIVTGYTNAGVITKDEALEDFVRKAHNLPKKMEGSLMDNGQAQGEDNGNIADESDEPASDIPATDVNNDATDAVELSDKIKNAKGLIEAQADKISNAIREGLKPSSDKFIADTMAKYKQLPISKKQDATTSVIMSGQATLKKEIKRILTETAFLALDEVKKEVPTKKEIKLSSKEDDFIRLNLEIKLDSKSIIPTHIKVLIEKQADLISAASKEELKNKLSFSYSSIETKVQDEFVIRQSMQDDAEKYIEASKVDTSGTNVAALIVNETRSTYFFNSDVIEEIHSFTFMNAAPKSPICRELAGTTFANNDAESLRFTPPLHHNCKSYLRANLKVSKGVERLEISTLSPSANAKKSITL